MAAGTSGIRIEIDEQSMKRLSRALKVLGEKDAPFLSAALDRAGQAFASAARGYAPGGIASRVEYLGVRGSGGAQRAVGRVRHPGSRSMEFGRVWYYRGYRGRNVSSGRKYPVPRGQRARPYLGVVDGGAAIGRIAPTARQDILTAIDQEWERIGAGGT